MISSPKPADFYIKNITLLFLIILAFFIRIIGATYSGMPHYTIDSQNYIWQAEILKKGGYDNYFPNGYPLIILVVSLFSPLEIGLLWLNIILSLCTILLLDSRKPFRKHLHCIVFGCSPCILSNTGKLCALHFNRSPRYILPCIICLLVSKRKTDLLRVSFGVCYYNQNNSDICSIFILHIPLFQP